RIPEDLGELLVREIALPDERLVLHHLESGAPGPEAQLVTRDQDRSRADRPFGDAAASQPEIGRQRERPGDEPDHENGDPRPAPETPGDDDHEDVQGDEWRTAERQVL